MPSERCLASFLERKVPPRIRQRISAGNVAKVALFCAMMDRSGAGERYGVRREMKGKSVHILEEGPVRAQKLCCGPVLPIVAGKELDMHEPWPIILDIKQRLIWRAQS